MLWLCLLAAVTVLSIALRRVLRRQRPLNDELFLKNVAVEHVQSGVAWVRANGKFGSVNQALAGTFKIQMEDLVGKEWFQIFPQGQQRFVGEQYSQMLLKGIANFDTPGVRSDSSMAWLSVRLVAVHDHGMRFVGHHCLIVDRTHERELEERVRHLTDNSPVSRIYASLHSKPTSPEASKAESESLGSPIAATH